MLNHLTKLATLAKYLSVRSRTTWFWVRFFVVFTFCFVKKFIVMSLLNELKHEDYHIWDQRYHIWDQITIRYEAPLLITWTILQIFPLPGFMTFDIGQIIHIPIKIISKLSFNEFENWFLKLFQFFAISVFNFGPCCRSIFKNESNS